MKSSFGKGCHLHLIDGSAYIFRAYHALPPLTRKSDGLPIGAVAGFCNILWNEISRNGGRDAPTHIAVVFDHSSKTFRNDIYPQYKANRPELPEDLRPQFPLTRDATNAFGVSCLETPGYEADDIIATLAKRAVNMGGEVTIISSDKDLMQLVGNGVRMRDPMKNRIIDRDVVLEKFGVFPEKVIDVQALSGDSVDNIPGAPGIGPKTAALLVREYGDLESLLERAQEIPQPKRRAAILDNIEQIRISKQLVSLDTNIALDYGIDDLEFKDPDPDALLGFLQKMEFNTLGRRISEKLGVAWVPPTPQASHQQTSENETVIPFDHSSYETIYDIETLKGWINQIYEAGYIAFDTETTSLDEMQAELVGISLSLTAGKAAYIPLGHHSIADGLFGGGQLIEGQLEASKVLALLKPVLEDDSILKIGQNIKYDMKIMARYGITLGPIDDTMLISYATNGGLHGHGMDALSERFLGHIPISIKSLLGGGKAAITFDKVAIADAAPYAAEDADITLRLWQKLKPTLHSAKVTHVYETLERPLVSVLARMEMDGILVDRDTLSKMSNSFAQSMAGLEAEISKLAEVDFNPGSPKQLGEVLFDHLQVPGGSIGKAGAYATGASVLEDITTIEDTHPRAARLASKVLDWRQLSKLKSTYTDALQNHINKETGRVHTSYSMAGTSTGRLASTDPNLQNIPIRTEEGRRIRKAFIAPAGKVLVSLDYSQIELRILAHIAKIPALQQAFKNGTDIHALTASEMFNVPLEGMDPSIRRRAKAINFGVIYGISGFGLARNLRISKAEAQGFIDRYFERFPGIREYMRSTTEFAKKEGYVKTLFGRKIHTPEINAKEPTAGFAKRAAINAPIQGTAADVIRRAMVKMPLAIEKLNAKMLLQVHDELLFEVDKNSANDLIHIAQDIMENAAFPIVRFDVPLTVDAGIGENWAEAH